MGKVKPEDKKENVQISNKNTACTCAILKYTKLMLEIIVCAWYVMRSESLKMNILTK